ncbi:MAG: DUF1570 domain-containing protein [Phycisphaerales bacterium]|nr:DUF1570 domain-containing protein [Phycisphaerales bacterium]
MNCFAQERQAQLSWWDRSPEQKIGQYWIKTDLPADEANSLARHLNVMYSEFSRRLADMPERAEEKLNVLIFKHRQDYILTLRARFGVNASASGGMFFVTSAAPAGALAVWTDDLPRRRIEHVIQHEGFHQFAYSRFGNDLPPWLNEGLAEFFGEAVVVGQQVLVGQSNARVVNQIKDAIELKRYVPFAQMLSITSKQWGDATLDESAALRYHQAWSMVQFLIYGEQGRHVAAFETFLKHLNTGLVADEAFKRAFGEDIADFEARWKRFASTAKPSAFATALERIEFLAQGALELNRRGTSYPPTLKGLRETLEQIEFKQTIETHGLKVELGADDDTLFTIPIDDLSDTDDPPLFTVTKTRLVGLTHRERQLEDSQPTPPTIATEHLRPGNLSIKWVRGDGFRFQIVVE